jgi:mxaA protein
MRRLIFVISFIFSSQLMAEEVTITLDRSWGLLIGDEVVASVNLPINTSEIDQDSLPQLGKRHGPWLYLQEVVADGEQLQLHYQLVNVPAETRQLATPTYTLRTMGGELVNIPSTSFSAGSFLNTTDDATTVALRGDQQLLAADFAPLQKQLFYATLVALLTALFWLIWHIGLRPGKRLPFAKAVFSMNKLRWFGHKDVDSATRVMHHAFNESAGTVVIYSQIQKLWDSCPWLVDLQPEITRFYQQSASHYFARNSQQSADFDSLIKLARACRAREKMA